MTVVPAKLLDTLRTLDRPKREVAFLLSGLALGLLAMPLLVWGAGVLSLGPYANGGFGALLADFLRGLADGSLACWLVLAGPYLVVSLLRLLRITLQALNERA